MLSPATGASRCGPRGRDAEDGKPGHAVGLLEDEVELVPRDGTVSASEVAKIDNETNSSLNEEPRSDLGK